MITSLNINDIPDYLISSELYENINSNKYTDNNIIEIPSEYYEKNIFINTPDDLIKYIRILDYWMVTKNPPEFYRFILENTKLINIQLLNNIFNNNNLIDEIELVISCNNTSFITSKVASCGNLNFLKYLHENNYPWNKLTCHYAAKYGHLNCLIYAHENGCPWFGVDICTIAIENGHVECLKYAHENGCLLNNNMYNIAAEKGYLDCLKYLHGNNCEWHEETCISAAENGHLDCLKYARENG